MERLVVLARLGGAELAALGAGIVFLLIMGYLFFGGGDPDPPKQSSQPKPPKQRR